jgi:hypothetical protein
MELFPYLRGDVLSVAGGHPGVVKSLRNCPLDDGLRDERRTNYCGGEVLHCALGNQPRMRAELGTEANKIAFKFIGGMNLKSDQEHHMHQAILTIASKDRFKAEWVSWKDGKASHKVKTQTKLMPGVAVPVMEPIAVSPPIPTGRSWCSSTSIFMAMTGTVWGQVTRPAGPPGDSSPGNGSSCRKPSA